MRCPAPGTVPWTSIESILNTAPGSVATSFSNGFVDSSSMSRPSISG